MTDEKEIGVDEVCRLACSQTLDGYTPNHLYASGACPDYMKSECNMGGKLFQDQWDLYQENLKKLNTERMLHASMRIPTQLVRFQESQASLLPPTSSQVFANALQTPPRSFF